VYARNRLCAGSNVKLQEGSEFRVWVWAKTALRASGGRMCCEAKSSFSPPYEFVWDGFMGWGDTSFLMKAFLGRFVFIGVLARWPKITPRLDLREHSLRRE